ncbi:hypothetical protein PoB_001628500 [Plakobranchus ocellatus]|uniref:Antifreeze protein n=1 Tax=Plakobranchus ocellatus TaxID=259542 RepID=A0AAV3Z2Z8_9GAST|nr:hypothetical protein PoB_001628500 [Plakobranchus ocellatus]
MVKAALAAPITVTATSLVGAQCTSMAVTAKATQAVSITGPAASWAGAATTRVLVMVKAALAAPITVTTASRAGAATKAATAAARAEGGSASLASLPTVTESAILQSCAISLGSFF